MDCDCVETFTVTGSTDRDGDGISDPCWEDGSGYVFFNWQGGCLATELIYVPAGGDPSEFSLDLRGYGLTERFGFFGLGNYDCRQFTLIFEDGRSVTASACTDCGTGECGDGVCNANEDVGSCPQDCTTCGDGLCTGDEDAVGCPGDCTICGDGLCTGDEDAADCPADCDFCPDDPNKTEPGNCGCGTPETSVFGDVNCDGVLDINDARLLNEQFGIEETSPCPGDVNRDGVVDGMDLTVVLGAWGLPCEVPGGCGDGVCDGYLENPASCPRDCGCVETLSVTGSTDVDGDGILDLCYSDGSGYFSVQWEGGCLVTTLAVEVGGEELYVYDLTDNEFTEQFFMSGQGEYVCYDLVVTFEDGRTVTRSACTGCGTGECGDGTCNANEDFTTCPDDCDFCPAGTVEDCVDAEECHSSDWVGDGYCDGLDQQWGANLCCYDADGGDCTEVECGST